MKVQSSLIGFLLFAIIFPLSHAQDPGWLDQITLQARSEGNEVPIARSQFIEVASSKLETAEHRLSAAPFVWLSESDADYFSQGRLRCGAPLMPYLVRGTYSNGGTGQFEVSHFGPNLLVAHGSLGPQGPEHRSALVACLDFTPKAVYGQVSGDL